MQISRHLMLGNFISYQRNKAKNKAKFLLLRRTYPRFYWAFFIILKAVQK